MKLKKILKIFKKNTTLILSLSVLLLLSLFITQSCGQQESNNKGNIADVPEPNKTIDSDTIDSDTGDSNFNVDFIAQQYLYEEAILFKIGVDLPEDYLEKGKKLKPFESKVKVQLQVEEENACNLPSGEFSLGIYKADVIASTTNPEEYPRYWLKKGFNFQSGDISIESRQKTADHMIQESDSGDFFELHGRIKIQIGDKKCAN